MNVTAEFLAFLLTVLHLLLQDVQANNEVCIGYNEIIPYRTYCAGKFTASIVSLFLCFIAFYLCRLQPKDNAINPKGSISLPEIGIQSGVLLLLLISGFHRNRMLSLQFFDLS